VRGFFAPPSLRFAKEPALRSGCGTQNDDTVEGCRERDIAGPQDDGVCVYELHFAENLNGDASASSIYIALPSYYRTMSLKQTEQLVALAERLGHKFADASLLHRALTHSSHAHEQVADGKPKRDRGNEQMEFLGDAVLGLAVADWLFRHHAEDDEGRLTRLRAGLVSRRKLSGVAERLGLGECLRLGRCEELSGGRAKTALLADALEAVIGAVYLDAGFHAAAALVEREVVRDAGDASEQLAEIEDSKSELQEWIQARSGRAGKRAEYALVSSDGPDHARRFTVELRWQGEALAQATAATKKDAQQLCARQALELLRGREQE